MTNELLIAHREYGSPCSSDEIEVMNESSEGKMTQQSGYAAMDWRIAVCREDTIAHGFGKIALSDRGLQSVCGELREVNRADLIAREYQPLCSACQRILESE